MQSEPPAFVSPVLNQLFSPLDAREVSPLLPALVYVAEHQDEIIASYPEFKGFHVPTFFQGSVFRSDSAPSIDAIRKLCGAAPEREVELYRYRDQWLIVVAPTAADTRLPRELRDLEMHGDIRLVAHTHPDDKEAPEVTPYPSPEDLKHIKGPQFIWSSQGLTRYGPPDSAYVSQVQPNAQGAAPGIKDIFAYYVGHDLGLTNEVYEQDQVGHWRDFLTEHCGLERAGWAEQDKIKALVGDTFAYAARKKA